MVLKWIGEMKVKPHHPLAELMAKNLHGIETVHAKEQRRMVSRACKEAAKWHDEQVDNLRALLKQKEWLMRDGLFRCMFCGGCLTDEGHKTNCELDEAVNG